jgi:hypothetical protein
MSMTPDPGLLMKNTKKQSKMKDDLNSLPKKMTKTDSVLNRAMGRMVSYQNFQAKNSIKSHNSHLKIEGDHYGSYTKAPNRESSRTPMLVRVENLTK